MRIKSASSVLLSILLVTSLTASVSIAILTTTSPPVFAAADNYTIQCVPDLGQHSEKWCWAAAAANSIYWYSQHGYLQLIDNRLNLIENDNTYINQMMGPHPIPPPPADMVYRLLHEIAVDCLYPGVPDGTVNFLPPDPSTWGKPINDNLYFYGLQEFIDEQGAPLVVREIVDNNNMSTPFPRADNIKVFYSPPTLENYKKEVAENHPVLLWLNYRHTSPYYEDTDHVVTGVGFGLDNTYILVSDPWTTGAPDHNNGFDNKIYDNLTVLSSAPLTVLYAGAPRQVTGLISISPEVPTGPVENFEKENMPDLGQHSENWCWVAAAANSFKWYFHNGYPKLMDDPRDNVLDENYLQLWPCPSGMGDNLLRLLHEIAGDCLYPNVPPENEITITLPMTYCHPIDDNKYFYGLQEFIREQGGQFKVREILDNSHFASLENIPPENDNVVIYDPPTFDNYKSELKQCHDVLLQLGFRNYNYETGNMEGLDHIVTGVSYYDGGPGNQWILVSDPWTPQPGPDHNSLENLYRYENLQVVGTDPLTVSYTGWTPGGPITVPVQVVKLILISPTTSWTGTATIHLENLYTVSLEKNLQITTGKKLVVKFYKYDNVTLQAGSVIENITPPQSVVENENVPHPRAAERYSWGTVQIATLVLTTDNENEVISTIASFTVYQSNLRARYMAILGAWSANPGQQSAFRAEVMDILAQWASAPS